MDRLELFIEMRPVGKERPQVTREGRVTFTPKKTADAEKLIRDTWFGVHGKLGLALWSDRTPLKLTVYNFLERPEKPVAPKPTRSGADWDNYGKTVSDALNGVAYHDDKQITDGRSKKLYAPIGKPPGILIIIEPDQEEQQIAMLFEAAYSQPERRRRGSAPLRLVPGQEERMANRGG